MEVHALPIRSYQNLRVYRRADALAAELFWITRHFPRHEHYALTSQLRRTSRAVSASIRRGWRRRYSAVAFRHHLMDAQSACARLGLWIDLAYESAYLTDDDYQQLKDAKAEVQRMLNRFYEQRLTMLA